MANLFPADGLASVGTNTPTVGLGLFQVELSATQASTTRSGLSLAVTGAGSPAVIYPRLSSDNATYDWFFTRNQADTDGLVLASNGNASFGRDLKVNGNLVAAAIVHCRQELIVAGGLHAAGPSVVAQKLQVGGALEVSEAATFRADVGVGGDLTLQGDFIIKRWKIAVPDYVFQPGHDLPPLEKVADFIRTHGHLPEVPSAVDLARDGMNTASLLLTLLKKIEELTLHALGQERRLGRLEADAPGLLGERP
ncbi:hypothetical protein DBR42_18685 [Pelomonas sp. HMWF004]|nr:hypothetical protein DBR42_18685 [Pelomonas sp. HMWF004]